MPDLILKTLHILFSMAMVAGIVGREFARSQMRKTADIKVFIELSALAGQFESKLVIPGSSLVVLVGVILGIIGDWPILGFLQGATRNWLLVSNLLILSMILVVRFIFLPRGKHYEPALQEAVEHGEVTDRLRASLNDPIVRWAHRWENASLIVIIILMITKPF